MRGSLCVSVVLAAIALLVAGAGCAHPANAPSATAAPSIAIPTAPAPLATAAEAPSPSASPTEAAGGPIPSGYRIAIPRLDIDLPIAEGDVQRDVEDLRTPEGYAFHLPGSALPGQNGNTYLYAHARRGMFLALWNARPGDEVVVTGPNGRLLVYIVGNVLPSVPPTDVSSTRPTASERLTLQTSTGPSPSDPRFVVFAFPRGARSG